MKPTNEDRRAIAKTLRRVAAINTASLSDGELMDFMMEIVLGGDVRMDPQDPDAEFLCCLADLIEPEERTCRMTVLENARGNPKYFLMYVCSECHGAVVHDKYDPIYYCPNCGAKVVEE